MHTRTTFVIVLSLALTSVLTLVSCATAPEEKNRASFSKSADSALEWFEDNTPGLRSQINNSAGYLIFPDVSQWGIIFGGGQFGRGELSRPNGTQIGWGAINTSSVGLQAGVRGFKMLMVFQDEAMLNQFMENKLTGSLGAVGVVAEGGGSGAVQFTNGLAVYEGASTGLMAGVNIALDYIRFKSLADE